MAGALAGDYEVHFIDNSTAEQERVLVRGDNFFSVLERVGRYAARTKRWQRQKDFTFRVIYLGPRGSVDEGDFDVTL